MTGPRKCILLLLLLPFAAAAQPRIKTQLDPPPADSFYRVFITPELTGWARADLSDLELRDSAKQPVPYLVDTLHATSSFSFINYPLLSINNDSATTYIELSVPEAGTGSFSISFGSTAAQRRFALQGSGDRKQWYSIDDNLELTPAVLGKTGLSSVLLHFPFSRYPYLRLVILNGKAAPLMPVQAGRIAGAIAPAAWSDPVRLNSARADSARYTVLHIFNRQRLLLERLSVNIAKPAYFARNVLVSGLRNNRWEPISTGVLSTGATILELPGIKDELIELRIENGDNPPLQVGEVDGLMRRYLLLTHLDKGGKYTLFAGDPKATAPNYDLAAFRDRIPTNAPVLKFGQIDVLEPEADTQKVNSKFWLWIAVIAGIVLLGWLSYSLLRDMGKEKEAPSSAGRGTDDQHS